MNDIKVLYEKMYTKKLVISITDKPLHDDLRKEFKDYFSISNISEYAFTKRVKLIIAKLKKEYDFDIIDEDSAIQLYRPDMVTITTKIKVDEKYMAEEGVMNKFGWFFSN